MNLIRDGDGHEAICGKFRVRGIRGIDVVSNVFSPVSPSLSTSAHEMLAPNSASTAGPFVQSDPHFARNAVGSWVKISLFSKGFTAAEVDGPGYTKTGVLFGPATFR